MTRLALVSVALVVLVGIESARAAEVCCGGLGCYSDDGDFFHIINRPIRSLPNCNLVSRIKLHLNTRANPVNTDVLDPFDLSTVVASHFDFSKETKVLVHGFTDNYAWPWWAETRTELLNELDVNVIRVDWAAGNLPPLIQAAANARLVGSLVAKLFQGLQTIHNYTAVKVHLIGHSLGAQLVGYIGSAVPQIGRITGIDPAGMYFTNMPVSVRLDPTDARLVDTINTDMGSIFSLAFGTVQPMGHLNFYANGGTEQPGCEQGLLSTILGSSSFNTTQWDTLATVTQGGYQTVMCNHYRALALFQETISSQKCPLKSYQCSSSSSFNNGDCFSCDEFPCSSMGLHLTESLANPFLQKKFYTLTSDRPPYCTSTYRVGFSLKPNSGDREERGNLFVVFHGSRGRSRRFQLNEDEIDLNPGSDHGFVVSTNQDLGPILAIAFEWDARFSILNPSDLLRRHYITIADSTLRLTNGNGQTLNFQLPHERLEEEREYRANLV